ncbi:MAG: phasin family protein [Methylocystis sp.]|uniref:phasin family protein n=1 Tax=Methylocystis sp. TaxID=1911079 RepID=UPI00395B4C3F
MIALDATFVSTTLKTYQDYAIRLMEFGQINTRSALQFVQDVWTAKSPDDFAQAMVNYGRRQFECWSEEVDELAATSGGEQTEDGEAIGLGD